MMQVEADLMFVADCGSVDRGPAVETCRTRAVLRLLAATALLRDTGQAREHPSKTGG
jgi:hypothetical protein